VSSFSPWKKTSSTATNLTIRIGKEVLPSCRTVSQQILRLKKAIFDEIVPGVFVSQCNIGRSKKSVVNVVHPWQ
jgi:hypothetical protein